jgi:hypothetical protein
VARSRVSAEEKGRARRIDGSVDDQSQKDEMRAALRGDRERMLERLREEGREPVFGTVEQAEPEAPEPEAPEPEPAPEPAPEPEPALTPPSAPVRTGWLRRLFGKRDGARE